MTPAAQEAQDLLTLIADTRASENEACAKIIDTAAERYEGALKDPYGLPYSEQVAAPRTARNLRFLAASIRARVTQ